MIGVEQGARAQGYVAPSGGYVGPAWGYPNMLGVVVVLVVVCGLWFLWCGVLGILVCGSWFVVNGLVLYGPILGLCWPMLPHLGAMLAYLEGNIWAHLRAMLAHLGAMLAHLGPILGLGWPILGLRWPILTPMLAHVDPSSATNSGKNWKKWEQQKTP